MFKIRSNKEIHKYGRQLRGSMIVIEGLIGVGKSTLGHNLEKLLNENGIECKFYEEYVNSELLQQYIENMEKYSYSFQLVMLLKRIEIYKEARNYTKSGGIAIIDRSLLGDYAFALMQHKHGNISDSEMIAYKSICKQEDLPEPDIIVYLNADVEICMNRITKRGRPGETKGYSEQYLYDLKSVYNEILFSPPKFSYVKIDSNEEYVVTSSFVLKTICDSLI
jgi:deoxyadenosine/deoxycytidine kinase